VKKDINYLLKFILKYYLLKSLIIIYNLSIIKYKFLKRRRLGESLLNSLINLTYLNFFKKLINNNIYCKFILNNCLNVSEYNFLNITPKNKF
jgi:hypothetical protein